MRIAQVAPLYESVPPKLYGGTERVVSYLTEELVARGHQVTLFASGDSVTAARLVPACPEALRLDRACRDPGALHQTMFEHVLRERESFDLMHFHTDYLHFGLARHLRLPAVTTLHGRLDSAELSLLYNEFSDMPVVSISKSQQAGLPHAHWVGAVHHGLPAHQFPFHESPTGGYLAFLGRVSPEKGLDRAIEIATRLEMTLRVAAKVDRADREYYVRTIAPLLHNPYVEFIGEITEAEKPEFLGNASALLFPIDWPEPFGLVVIEALALGTPVVAFRRGSVPELVAHGETGFVVDTVEQAVAAVRKIPGISRRRCRDVFEERFSVARMTDDYLSLYAGIARGGETWTRFSPSRTNTRLSPPKAGLTTEPVYSSRAKRSPSSIDSAT